LGLSLSEQLYGGELEKVPVGIRMENYLVSSGILLKEYEKGYREGMLQVNDNLAGQILKLMLKSKELEQVIVGLRKTKKVIEKDGKKT